jgi:5-methylcytosine-specific restriction endonuclease McrA
MNKKDKDLWAFIVTNLNINSYKGERINKDIVNNVYHKKVSKHCNRINHSIPNWNKIRKNILGRDLWRCRICGEEHILHVHHIDWNRANNNKNNLVTVCSKCHRAIHEERYFPWEHEGHPIPWGDINIDCSD